MILFDLDDQEKLNQYKRNYIGTLKVSSDEYLQMGTTGIWSIDELCERIRTKDKKHAYVVYKYFSDMIAHFKEMRKILIPKGHYVLVVGDSLVSNEPVFVHSLIQDCARACGYETANCFSYEIRNRSMRFPRHGRGGIVRYDWIIDLENGD